MSPESILSYLRAIHGVNVTTYRDESEWLEAKRHIISASEMSCLCNRNSFQGILKLWYVKAGLIDGDSTQYAPERRQGHRMESVITDGYVYHSGRSVADPGDYTIVTNDAYPGLGATLDRFQWCPERGFGCGPELKNQKEWMRKYWADGKVHAHALIQSQCQMLLTGMSWCSVAVCIGGDEAEYRDVEANPRFQQAMVRRANAFMVSLENQEPPEPTGHDTDFEVFDELFHEELKEESTIDVGASLREVFDELEEIAAKRKPLESRENKLKAMVRAAMGGHTRALGLGYEFKLSGESHRLTRKGN